MELNHVFHLEHKLSYNEKVVKKEDKDVIYCVACLTEILSEYYYSCGECKFFLHKLCAEVPLEFIHHAHVSHYLRLLPKSPYENGDGYCQDCGQKLEGFIYHCRLCMFSVHLRCAFHILKPDHNAVPDGLKLNFCHNHTLTYEKVVKRADKGGLVCAACLEQISGPLADYFSCRPCNFFLHKLCSQWPLDLTIPLHPQHSLRLLPGGHYKARTGFCRVCHKATKGFFYACSVCKEFLLDFKCAFPHPDNRTQNFEPLHHHPLVFQPRPAKFRCDICSTPAGDVYEDQSYSCSTCDFWIHKGCAFTTLAQRYKDHQHPLSLVQGVPEDLQIYEGLNCDVCHKAVSPEDVVSHCARCRYFVHVRCMLTDDTDLMSSIKDGVDYLEDSFFKHLFKDDEFIVANWPPRDTSLDLIQPFLLEKNDIVMDVKQKLRHYFSHEQHEMTLFEEPCVNNESFFEEEDEEIICDACIHPITAPYYFCQDCNYYVHLGCANLPSQIKHFSHPCELRLTFQKRFYTSFSCNRCYQFCNGYGYECKNCNFALDLTCAALPAVIMHETHEHPLFEMEAENEGLCYACNRVISIFDLIFMCTYCDVYLHYKCAVRSRSIRHKWDRQHPILLRYQPHGDHPDHFMCDMCAELIHPMRWLYSCFQCDISFHIECVGSIPASNVIFPFISTAPPSTIAIMILISSLEEK